MRRLGILGVVFWSTCVACYAQSISWNGYGVEGKTFELVDPENTEIYRFGRDGLVTAVMGRKRGPVTGPILYWRLAGESLVISSERGGEPMQALVLITVGDGEVSARDKSDQIVHYKVAKVP
jgi:hypothetical protein